MEPSVSCIHLKNVTVFSSLFTHLFWSAAGFCLFSGSLSRMLYVQYDSFPKFVSIALLGYHFYQYNFIIPNYNIDPLRPSTFCFLLNSSVSTLVFLMQKLKMSIKTGGWKVAWCGI